MGVAFQGHQNLASQCNGTASLHMTLAPEGTMWKVVPHTHTCNSAHILNTTVRPSMHMHTGNYFIDKQNAFKLRTEGNMI